MRKHILKLIPAFLIIFVASFMLFIYEPILTYSSNIDEFWFDFDLMIPNIFLYALLLNIFGFAFFIAIYIIDKCFVKSQRMYKTILIISWIIFICTYIQGNYLVGSLPVLDGTTIIWNDFLKENIISLCIIIILTITEIIAVKKMKYSKIVKINTFITGAIFIMLIASLTSVLTTPNLFSEKTVVSATNDNFMNLSSDKNLIVFLADAVDSKIFNTLLNESEEYNDMLKDFTYFKDSAGGYCVTKDSIPLILTSKWNKNEKIFSDFYNEAFDESKLLEKLEKNNYNMSFYENEIFFNRKNAKRFDNLTIYSDRVDRIIFLKQLTKYLLFKYLPYQLKKYSKIETADFKNCRISYDDSLYYQWDNDIAYNMIKSENLIVDKNKCFKFYHIEGGHVPFNYDENLNRISEEEGSYGLKILATMKVIKEFLNKLKENNLYDNSAIVILADHGIGPTEYRANPMLYIKGFDEHHEKNEISEIPVSYEDLVDAFNNLIDGKKSSELFYKIDDNRKRTFIENFYKDENHLVEYVINGKSWDADNIVKTGVEYNRE